MTLLIWLLLTFDLCYGHHCSKLVLAGFIWPSLVPTKHTFSPFDLLWPLTSMRIINVLSLHQAFIWPSLVPIIAHTSPFDLSWPLTSIEVTIILNLQLGFIWPSLVSIHIIYPTWPLLTFDLYEGHHCCKLAKGFRVLKFGTYSTHFSPFDLCWPLTSEKVTIVLNL